jgi:hypothetical protein
VTALILTALPVALLLGFLGFLLGLPPLGLLRSLLACFALPLLCPPFGLLLLVAGEGVMWPNSFALKELTAAEEARIGALVKKAVS